MTTTTETLILRKRLHERKRNGQRSVDLRAVLERALEGAKDTGVEARRLSREAEAAGDEAGARAALALAVEADKVGAGVTEKIAKEDARRARLARSPR